MTTPPQPNPELEHQRMISLINSMADGVVAIDQRAKIIDYNGAALDVLDVNAIQRGQAIEEIIKLLDEQNNQLDTRQVILATKIQTISRDYKVRYADDSYANIYLSISPVHLGYDAVGERGYVLIIRDITREKSLEEERDEFISVVSHELRTPAAITEGAVDNALFLLKKNTDHDKIIQALETAHKQSKMLEDLINDLSTLARAERGTLSQNIEDINVHELIEHVENSYLAQAEEKGLNLYSDIDPQLRLLHNSKLYVQEILQNFITNAIKYTQEGSVTVYAKQLESGVEIRVSDTGIGISKGDQARVFDKFFRSGDLKTREQKGTGIGLYVTAKIAKLAGAQIDLESELGQGSTFTITIPDISNTDD